MAIVIQGHKYLVEIIKDFYGKAFLITLYQDCLPLEDCFKVVMPVATLVPNGNFSSDYFPTSDKEGYKETLNEVRKDILDGKRRGRRIHDINDFVRTGTMLLEYLAKYRNQIGSISKLDRMRETLSMMILGDIQSNFGPTCEKQT